MLLDETRVRVSLSPMFLGETPPPYGPMSCCAHSRTKGRFFCSSAVVNRLPLRAHKEKNDAAPSGYGACAKGNTRALVWSGPAYSETPPWTPTRKGGLGT